MANLNIKAVQSGSARPLLYVGIAVAIAMWSTAVLCFAINIVPLDVYWMSYYAVDYTFGFVRRGLAGELVGLVPGHYFAVALGLRWLSTAIYLCALGLVAGVVLFGRRRSARRLMVAMLIPLLPFGIPFAAYSARPDLFGAAALAVFAVALPFARSRTVALAWCTAYGLAIAALTLVHEAIGLQFALGAVLAIVVLGNTLGTARRRGVLLAVAPGVLTAIVVAAFGRHDIAPQLCSAVPHHTMPNPLATITSLPTLVQYVFGAQQSQTDYHDWVCRNVMPIYDYGVVDAMRIVANIGVVGLAVSLVFGVAAFAATMYGISGVSGVPLRAFVDQLRGSLAWAVAGLVLIIPVFLTGFDWTRWLIIVSFDVAIVFTVFAARRHEIDQEPTPKALRLFVFLVIALALVPIGTVPGFGGPRII
jgi:hypothetical protein